MDDPAHGHQQLTFWHGYYDQNQYLPLLISCAENDQFVLLSLRPGNVHAALGAEDDLEHLVHCVRQRWPDVVLGVRGDSAFGTPRLYEVCERLRLLYTFGLAANAVLQRQVETLLQQAVTDYAQERHQARAQERRPQPLRRFRGFWYQAGTWDRARFVVAKVEVNEQETNRRFVVSNRPGAELSPGPTYDEYVERGESENRNKEIKCGLGMDRLSDHRFCANYFRLYLHTLAHNLLVRLRRQIAEPWPGSPKTPEFPAAPAEPSVPAAVPAEAQVGEERRRQFRQRRQRDPLGEGQPCTWRMLLIKVAAEVVVSARRVVVRLSSSWPHLDWYRRVCARLAGGPVVASLSG